MPSVHECNNNVNVLRTLSIQERKNLWDFRMRGCRDILSKVDFDYIVKEAYNDIFASFSDSDSDSSSSGSSIEVLMEIADSFDQEVISYDHSSTDEVEIVKLLSLRNYSSTRNEYDVILEPCILGERVCIVSPSGVKDEYFYFYVSVLEDFKIHIPFSDFESNLLITIKIAPSQLLSNS